jgi:DME family drug/metabolite transporter
VASVVFGIVGGVVIALSGGPASVRPAGVAFALASSSGYAAYALVSGRFVRRTDPLTAATWVAFGAAAGIAIWGLGRGGFGALPGRAAWWVVAMAVATAAAFALWFLVVGRLGSSRTAIIMILEAPMGIALTAAVFGDPVSLSILFGGVLVLTGAGLAAVEVPDEIEAIEAATPP